MTTLLGSVFFAFALFCAFLGGRRLGYLERAGNLLGIRRPVQLLGLPQYSVNPNHCPLPPMTEDDKQWLGVFRETVEATEGRVSPFLSRVLEPDVDGKIADIFAAARREAEKERSKIIAHADQEASFISLGGAIRPKHVPATCSTCGAEIRSYRVSIDGGLTNEDVTYSCRGGAEWSKQHGMLRPNPWALCPNSTEAIAKAKRYELLLEKVAAAMLGVGAHQSECEEFLANVQRGYHRNEKLFAKFPRELRK